MTDIETSTNLSDDDNSSCSNSEMDYEDSLETKIVSSGSHHHHLNHHNNNNNNNSTGSKKSCLPHQYTKDNSINLSSLSPLSTTSSSRRNKRKNFKPRNIHEYEGSGEDEGVEPYRNNNNATNINNASYKQGQLLHVGRANQRKDSHEHEEMRSSDEFGEETPLDSHRRHRFERTSINNNNNSNETSDSDNGADTPLDLSEVQNESTHKGRKSSSSHSHSILEHAAGSSAASPQLQLPPQSTTTEPQQFFHPFFSPMDLRLLSATHQQQHQHHLGASGRVDQHRNEFNVNNITSYSNTTPPTNNNNYPSHDIFTSSNVNSTINATTAMNNCSSDYTSSVLSDFAQSTMKELLGLYGIGENLRQTGGGGMPVVGRGKTTTTAPTTMSSMDIQNYDLSLDSSSSRKSDSSSKIMIPENMARFLAAVHESVTLANATNNSLPRPSPLLNNSSSHSHLQNPLNFANQSSSSNSLLAEHSVMTAQNAFLNGNEPSLASAATAGRSDLKSQLHNSSSNENNSYSSTNYMNTRSKKQSLSPSPEKNLNNNSSSSNQSLLLNQPNKNQGGIKAKGTATGKSANFDLTSFPVIREGLLGKGSGPVDYTRYVKRYENCSECGYQHCQDLNYKEHFHCLQCCDGGRVFIKKDEMIRHFKWHKKRDESLQHGFMRYSSSDNCNDRFNDCPHNRKQTHYHCIHDGCAKVYVSTSDVQMHSNYHRKDIAIIQEGFQRFRATEDCRGDHCSFRRQHTTHFHCRRDACLYTFKNKADMEKHKAYHLKGEQMGRDGFKKFMKHEICNFSTCRFSRVCNHIHCIREGCNYVLHSSGQLYSHKRKHERRDSELAYRRFKLAQSIMRGSIIGTDLSSMSWSDSLPIKSDDDENSRHSSNHGNNDDSEDVSEKLIEQCDGCDMVEVEHFHCRGESCNNSIFYNSDDVGEHTRTHELQDRISSLAYFTVDPANFDAQDSTIPCVSAKCPFQNSDKHYHCLWGDCAEIVLPTDTPFKRLEHFKTHEAHKTDILSFEKEECDTAGPEDGFFKRKRGRPLKNRTIEMPGPNESIFTSFKLPKPHIPGTNPDYDAQFKDPIGFTSYHAKSKCPDTTCPFNTSSSSHYHCAHPRCHFAVKDVHKLSLHLRDFHSNVDILDGYEYFEKSTECHKTKCEFNGNTNHFHCTRDDYIFQRYSSMAPHEAECHESKSNPESSSDEEEEEEKSRDEQFSLRHKDFFPQSKVINDKGSNGIHPMDLSTLANPEALDLKSISDHSLSRILQLPETSETQFGPDCACGRPFCKLKRKQHFHCHLCNQAFSEIEKLRPHILKHNNLSGSSTEHDLKSQNNSQQLGNSPVLDIVRKDEKITETHNSPQLDISSTLAHSNFLGYPPSYLFLQQHPLSSIYAGMMFGQNYPPSPELLASQLAPPNKASLLLQSTTESHLDSLSPLNTNSPTNLNLTPLKRPPSNSSSPSSPPPESKKQRMQLRILKDEPVPDGYVRFRFNEDCTYAHCGYREHQTHFHCVREDCGYSFCDKTRFVQHTARHDRLDSLMGGDFKQYRANVACGRDDCNYIPGPTTGTNSTAQNKASHFHCCKCDYVCTDTNKVVAHRRQHQKMDSITACGFEKYTPSQMCNDDSCIHVQKQTHYHCIKCNFSVLGLSQMSAHKYRHDEENSGNSS